MAVVPLTVAAIVTATRGQLMRGQGDLQVGAISIDSRTAAAGQLFFAIRGERFDGHAFASAALERGAMGMVVDRSVGDLPATCDPIVIVVEDTTRALQDLARYVRRESGAKVVAITGSAGKTTTKEIAAEFLSARYEVFRNKGNLNNHIGLPLSLLELRSAPDVAVVEFGMNHPGEIRTLVGIAEPNVRVWTNVGDAHLGFFESPDEIADAKAEILENARAEDVLVTNADDERVAARAKNFTGRLVRFGIAHEADVRATAVELRGLDGSTADVQTPCGSVRIHTPLLGTGNLYNVLAAMAVAIEFGVALDEVAARAVRLAPAHHRGELLRLPGGITLIDDSYNSSPSALRRTLETVRLATGSARKVAVLGEMLELGVHADALHEECGSVAAAAGLNLLIAVGGDAARALADAAVRSGMAGTAVVHVPSKQEAAEVALQRIRPGDLVLVKGSRGIGTDLVVDRLKAEFA